MCENPLRGNILQLNIVASYPRRCAAQNEETCKIQLQEELKSIFSRLPIIPITIRFSDDRYKTIDIKMCSLSERTGEFKESVGKIVIDIDF